MDDYFSKYNFCDVASRFQAVPSYDETKQNFISHDIPFTADDIETAQINTLYSCPDNYQMGAIQDNQLYIATTDGQHNQIANHQHVDADCGLSGYFSDQATIDACKNGDLLDNAKYNEMCQIAPYRPGGMAGEGEAKYKAHVDCFDVDRETLFKEYGTYDFNAAIAKCEANNQFGAGGGNQGYNPHISEMIDKGVLKYNPSKSYSDASISKSEYNNPNHLNNSIVPEAKADQMYSDAQTRAMDCVKSDTRHPSPEACNNGFLKNENPIECNTGNAIILENSQTTNGTLPENKQPIDLSPLSQSDKSGVSNSTNNKMDSGIT